MKAQQVKPEIGMGATMWIGSDAYPYTIVGINKKGTRLTIQPDRYELVKDSLLSETQIYNYSPSIVATDRAEKVSLRANGSWKMQGQRSSITIRIGYRRAYKDPSF